MPRRRTPAEKKQLSYERDRRYGAFYSPFYEDGSKTARKSVPRRKRHRARMERRRASQGLAPGALAADLADGEHVDAELLPRRMPYAWKKRAGDPLRVKVGDQRRRRRELEDRAGEPR